MSLFIFLVILVVLIVSHEIGHFAAAKFFGVKVDEFAVGFPPRLWSKRKGETVYSVNALPFGGYVKIYGESIGEELPSAKDRNRAFVGKPRRVQSAIVAAGVFFNIILAWVLFSAAFLIGIPASISGSDYAPYAKNVSLTIVQVSPGTPAEEAGFKAGDKIIEIGTANPDFSGTPLTPESDRVGALTREGARKFIETHPERLAVIVMRGEERKAVFVVPEEGIAEGGPAIGVSLAEVGIVKLPIFKSILEGGKRTVFIFNETAKGLYGLIKNALLGNGSLDSVSGPVGLVKIVGEVSAFGFGSLLSFTALISVNLAIINLIPIPALDGGRLLFILIEAMKRSPIKPSVANAVNGLGFVLLIMLMVVVTYNDIARIFG